MGRGTTGLVSSCIGAQLKRFVIAIIFMWSHALGIGTSPVSQEEVKELSMSFGQVAFERSYC